MKLPILLLLLLALSCATTTAPPKQIFIDPTQDQCENNTQTCDTENDDPRDDDVRFYVLKELFEKHASNAEFACAYVEQKADPSDALLERLQNFNDKIVPQSLCSISSEGDVRNGRLHKAGVIIGVSAIRYANEVIAVSEGQYYFSLLGASSTTYVLELTDDEWRIKDQRLNWLTHKPHQKPPPLNRAKRSPSQQASDNPPPSSSPPVTKARDTFRRQSCLAKTSARS